MRATSDAVILLEALYSEEQLSVGLVMLIPPRRAGRVKSSLSRELIDFLPVIAGRRRFRMESSRGIGDVWGCSCEVGPLVGETMGESGVCGLGV